MKINKSDDYDDPEGILKSLITGFFANVAQRQVDGTYRNIRSPLDEQLVIHPSSVLANIKPKWIMYNEIVVTAKKYMRDVSAIQVEWLLELAPHFYVDKRKQLIESHHRQEAIRNLDHDKPKAPTEETVKQVNRFKKGINLAITAEPETPKAIESGEPAVYKRLKKSGVLPKQPAKKSDVGLSFDDDY